MDKVPVPSRAQIKMRTRPRVASETKVLMETTKQFFTVFVDAQGRKSSQFSDWHVDEADYFRQVNEVVSGWKVISKVGNVYTISFEKVL